MVFRRCAQKTVDADKIGMDSFVPADRLDPVYGGDLTVVTEAGHIFSPDPDQLGITVVQLGSEVGRRSHSHANADAAAVDDNDESAKAAQLIGDRQPGDPGANHNDVTLSSAESGVPSIVPASCIQNDRLPLSLTR
jgi:hypothetical protein